MQMCMYVRACVCVCLREKEEEQDRCLILLSQFQVRRRRGRRRTPAPLSHVEMEHGETLVEQSRTLVRRQLDPRQTQPESPGTTRQLLDEKNGQQVRLANCLLI